MRIFRSIIIILFCLFVSTALYAQSVLTGIVKDETGETVIGASIYVENKDHRSLVGTVAGLDGDYKLQVPNEKDMTVVFSMIGYKVKRIKYTGQTVLNVTLEDDAYVLDNVEVVAKAVERNQSGLTQREFVAATQKVEMTMLETAPVSSIEDALQGRMSNVDIITSAEPGASSTIRIRGTSSLNASNDPLIVIDGIPYPTSIGDDFEFSTATTEDFGALLNIPPNDIASIEVLKDAAATSIYGSAGSSGVLLIETKKGHSGKTSFTFDAKYSFNKERSTIPMLNSQQYVAMIQDAIWNTVNDLGASNSTSQEYLKYLFDTKEIGFDPSWAYFKEYNQQTDWLDEITQTAQTYEANFSMSGGGEKANYRLSLGYFDQEGTTIGSAMKRLNASFNLTYRFSNKMDITTFFSFVNSDKDSYWTNPRGHAFTKMPNMSPYYMDENNNRTGEYFTPQEYFQGTATFKDGEVKGAYNPVAMVKESKNQTTQTDSRFNFSFHYKLLKGLDYYIDASMSLKKNKTKKFLPQSVTGVPWTDTSWFNRSADIITDNTFIYTKNRLVYVGYFGEDHKLTGNVSFETNDSNSSSYSSQVSGNASPATSDPTAGNSNIVELKSGVSQSRSIGINSNAHYGFKERYMINLGYRREANSAMSSDNRWAGFSTVGVAWVPSEEAFLKDQKWMSYMKLRASWGQSGRTPSGAYQYMGTFQAIENGYIDMPAAEPNQIQLNKLKWETVIQRNLGVDASFFDDKVMVTADVYRGVTSDLLHKKINVPSSSGYSNINWFNSGSMSNEGWEFRVDWHVLRTKDWGLSLNANMAQNRNKVEKIPDNMFENRYEAKNEYYAYIMRSGDAVGSFYGYKYKGVYQNVEETYARDNEGNLINDMNGKPVIMTNIDRTVRPGDAKYEDVNGDGIIDKNDIVYLGNSNPLFTGGTGFELKYKDFMLSALFNIRIGQKVINQTRISTENMYGKNNQSTAVLSRWRSEGDDTDIPRALYGIGYNYLGSDRFVETASFMRLNNATIRYNIPKELLRKWGLSRMYVYCTGYNLFTWTKYTGQDPEVKLATDSNYDTNIYQVAKDNSNTPKSRSFLFGVSLSY